ncbi:MAG TPA: OmpA family protein [Bacteroidales bacterium]|nr:OmpA family protein [Bacteroidales bacterium]
MKTVLLVFFILLLIIPLKAQEKSPAELKELFYDAEFFFAQEEYLDALYDYQSIYTSGYKDNANINYRMGICYLNIPGQKEKSIGYLLEAVKNTGRKYNESINQKNAPFDAWLFLGNAYRVNNKLSDAIATYTKYKELAGSTEDIKYADQQITACNTAIKFMANPVSVKFTNLGDSVNGTSSNFKAVVSGNGKVILYMNELPFYNAVYFSKLTLHGWSSPVNITPQIQSDGDQYVTSVSYDGMTLYLTREDPFNSDIFVSHFINGVWSKSVPVAGTNVNTKFWESHASVSKDGSTLFFTSNRKGGYGEMDIYKSVRQTDGNWGEPINLGPNVNTALNEDTPFITDNDSLLYFSSQGHENMGGYDIFVCKTAPDGWSSPENIGYPVNTTDDDLFFYPWNNDHVAFVSRILEDSHGKEDVYALQKIGAPDINTVLADHIRSEQPKVKEETSPSVAQIPVAQPETAPIVKAAETPTAEVAPAAKPANVKTVPEAETIILKPEIELDPVYFGFDNFLVNDNGKLQLHKVFRFLLDNPGASVKLTGHADSKGPEDYNLKLSQKRADAAKKYLTGLGIDPSRVEAIGMGESDFAAVNANADGTDNPEGRHYNRRVEYEISSPKPVDVRVTPVPENLKYKK